MDEIDFPVPVLAETESRSVENGKAKLPTDSANALTTSKEAIESITVKVGAGSDPLTSLKARAYSIGGEKNHPTCEFPKPSGKGICGQPATEVVTFSGLRWSYAAKACSKCAKAVKKEAKANTLNVQPTVHKNPRFLDMA